jgi:predicted lipid-binding transport protein (Tim44 family)
MNANATSTTLSRSCRSSAPSRAPATTQSRSAPPAVPQQGGSSGLLSGMMGTVAQGFAFGTGSAIAHRTVGAVANSIGGGSGSEQPAPEHGAYEQQVGVPLFSTLYAQLARLPQARHTSSPFLGRQMLRLRTRANLIRLASISAFSPTMATCR